MSLEERLSLLPDDLRELVRSLPPDKAHEVLDQLIQPAELSFRALCEQDVEAIKVQMGERFGCSEWGARGGKGGCTAHMG